MVNGFLPSLKMSTAYCSATAYHYRLMYATCTQPFVAQVIVRGQLIKGDMLAFVLVTSVFTAWNVAASSWAWY